jgi:SAM-dependent methyltransferase
MSDVSLFPATAMPDRDWWEALWPAPDEVLRRLGFGQGQAAVDICCGDGLFTAALARLGAQPLYGLDLDAELLDQARNAVRETGRHCHWIEGDARRLAELVPPGLDAALIANTFHGVPDQTGLARAVARTLRPGGCFVVIGWHALPREATIVSGVARGPRTDLRQSPEQTAAAVQPAGFDLEAVEDLPPYHYGVVFRRR